MCHKVPLFKTFLPPKNVLMPALEDVLYSGYISEGSPVEAFEKKFEECFNLKNCVSFNSGTAALHAALVLAGVEQGDEVISTPMTAEPTNMAIKHAGGKIVWADVDPCNGNLTAESISANITNRTKAIMVVHYGGIPAPIKSIREVAKAHGLPVIEDAAHTLGSKYDGKPIGHHSEFVMFSFQAIKHMTTIDGGMLSCQKKEDAQKGKIIRWFGIDRKADRTNVDIKEIGYKYHMTNIPATIGIVQLDYIKSIIDRHIDNGKYYDDNLKNIEGLEICSWDNVAEPSYWFYTVLVERQADFIRHFEGKGISATTVHKRNDLHSVFADSCCPLPGVDTFYSRMVHIPCGWWVTNEDREFIVETINEGW